MAPPNKCKQKMEKVKLVGISKNKSKCRRLFNYSEENLNKAIEDIKNKTMGIREACRNYGLPKTTVHDRLSGKIAANKKPKVGPDPVLGREGEKKLKNWVLDSAKCGFPINKMELLESVSKIIKDTGIKNPFKDGIPGDTWYQSFLRRHPELSVRQPKGNNNARAAITENRIRAWFTDLKKYMESIDASDIFEDSNRIFNGDETGFSLCPKSGKVLGPRGYKNLYIIKKSNEKDNITVLIVFTASGKICPPLVIFPYVRPPKALIDSMPRSWVLGRSESGWMRSDVFYEYVSNSFNAWLTENNIKKPVLLFIDGHKSHMTLSLSQFCEQNGIILYALPANTTHILQPADVSVFKPLKQESKKTVRSWQAREENINQTVTKINFCKILNETLTTIDLKDAIINGFRKCGLYPLNEDSVDYTKCVKDTQQRIRVSNSNNKKPVCAKDYDTATKIISLIQGDISKHNIDTKVILAEIDKAKTKFLANRRSKSKTPRTSAASNESISILANDQIHTNIAVTPDNLSFIEQEFALPQNLPSSSLHFATTPELLLPERFNEDEFALPRNLSSSTSHIAVTPDNLNVFEYEFNLPRTLPSFSSQNINDLIADAAENSQNISLGEPGSFVSLSNVSIMPFELSQNQNDAPSENKNVTFSVTADIHEAPKSPHILEDFHSLTLTTIQNNSMFDIIECEDLQTSQKNNTTQEPLTLFQKHLHYPERSSDVIKVKSSIKLPSAISSSAWREFYNKKNEDKENKALEKIRKKKLRADIKERKTKENEDKKRKKIKAKTPNKPSKNVKCSQCSDDLISDVEDDAEKNIGCDSCVRWYHLKCTTLENKTYVEAALSDYTCPFC